METLLFIEELLMYLRNCYCREESIINFHKVEVSIEKISKIIGISEKIVREIVFKYTEKK